MTADAKERAFQADIIREMVERGWVLGEPAKYDRELALYTEDCLAFVKNTQPKAWEKYQKLYPHEPEKAFIARVASQLNKVDPHASNKELRKYGTLGVLRHELRDKSASFKPLQSGHQRRRRWQRRGGRHPPLRHRLPVARRVRPCEPARHHRPLRPPGDRGQGGLGRPQVQDRGAHGVSG